MLTIIAPMPGGKTTPTRLELTLCFIKDASFNETSSNRLLLKMLAFGNP